MENLKLATSIVLIAMLIVRFTGINIDGISGLFVAVLILYAGYGAAKDTLMPLLGQSPDRKFVDKIEEIAGDVLNIVCPLTRHSGIMDVNIIITVCLINRNIKHNRFTRNN